MTTLNFLPLLLVALFISNVAWGQTTASDYICLTTTTTTTTTTAGPVIEQATNLLVKILCSVPGLGNLDVCQPPSTPTTTTEDPCEFVTVF